MLPLKNNNNTSRIRRRCKISRIIDLKAQETIKLTTIFKAGVYYKSKQRDSERIKSYGIDIKK